MQYRASLRTWIVFAALPVAASSLAAQQATGPEIKVGGIFDLTGITSDVGKSYAQAVRDAVEWTNSHGGINGKRIKLVDVDYGYKIPEAIAAYKRMVNDDKVVMIAGWGTGDTEALRGQAATDKIPYVSASFAAPVSDPSKNPYNFFVAPTYSDQLRAWLQWVKDDWKDKSRAPRVAALFGDNAYGRAPLAAGKDFAKQNGIDWVYDGVFPGAFQDATSQLLGMQKAGADYAYINITTTGESIILKDAQKLGLKTKFGCNPYGYSEALAQVAKGAAEGVTGVMPHPPYGTKSPRYAEDPGLQQRQGHQFAAARCHIRPRMGHYTDHRRGPEARRQSWSGQRRGHQEGFRDAEQLRPGWSCVQRNLHRDRSSPVYDNTDLSD